MQKWEYYNCLIVSPGIDDASHEARMSLLGDDGWELVSVIWSPEIAKYRMFFKRPKLEDPSTPYRG